MDRVYIIIGIAWFVLDQLTKQWVQASFLLGESLPVIPNVFHLTYILNKGAALAYWRISDFFSWL